METYAEQGTAGQTLCWEGAAAKPLCQEPKLLKDAGLPSYWEALKGRDGGLGGWWLSTAGPRKLSGACYLQHGQPPGTPSVPSALPQTSIHPPQDHHPPHHHCQCHRARGLQALSTPPGKPPQPHGKCPPQKVLLSALVPTPAVSGLQSPPLLSQPASRGTHEPFPDHHGTSGHPETRPGLSTPQGKTEPSG